MKEPRIIGKVDYDFNGKKKSLSFDGNGRSQGDGLSVESSLTAVRNGFRLMVTLVPSVGITISNIEISHDAIESPRDLVFMNGYQSWTDSKEFSRRDRMRAPERMLGPLIDKHWLTRYADYEFQPYPGRPGVVHGASYGYVRAPGDTGNGDMPRSVRFFGSLDEASGFTFFHADIRRLSLTARKDLEGLSLKGRYRAFDLLFSEGSIDEVMDGWFSEMGIRPQPAEPAMGWTSWYNYYQDISERIILENLQAFKNERMPIRVFQIDDGYQTAVGDWLSINERFPNGMKPIADRIAEAGFTPGIWLAPFAAETTSRVFRDHPDWFIKGDDGRPYATGSNWSGFYSMDIDNREVRDYVRKVISVVTREWGFKLVKLDFLYGACIRPLHGKTRGQIMCEAMDFLRECVGDSQILGCGVPLWPAFGKVEYCRIGTDVDLQWHNKLYGRLIHREFPSTRRAIQNSITRRHLDGRAFINDPDVFLLRHTNIKLTKEQRKTLFYVNMLFGNLFFTSDDIREYTIEERELFVRAFSMQRKKILWSELNDGLCLARFVSGPREFFFMSNLTGRTRSVRIPSGGRYLRLGEGVDETKLDMTAFGNAKDLPLCPGGARLRLRPYVTKCLLCLET